MAEIEESIQSQLGSGSRFHGGRLHRCVIPVGHDPVVVLHMSLEELRIFLLPHRWQMVDDEANEDPIGRRFAHHLDDTANSAATAPAVELSFSCC